MLLSFVVETDGTTSNITVLDSSNPPYFVKPSIKAVEKWKYKPSIHNGVPVRQVATKVILSYSLEQRGGSRKFRSRTKAINKLLEKGDFEGAEKKLQELENMRSLNLYEYSFAYLLWSRFYIAKGDYESAVVWLRKAVRSGDETLDKKAYVSGLEVLFQLEAALGNFQEALGVYERLKKAGKIEQDGTIEKTRANILAAKNGPQPIATKARLRKNVTGDTSWHHEFLRRREFSFEAIEGELSEFRLYCGSQWLQTDVKVDFRWRIESPKGPCDIYVYGNEGTSFTFIEY